VLEGFRRAHQIEYSMHVGGLERLVLERNDNRKYKLYTSPEHKVLGWFDDWAMYTHYIHGPFFRCCPGVEGSRLRAVGNV
jgi:hypothetical protein